MLQSLAYNTSHWQVGHQMHCTQTSRRARINVHASQPYQDINFNHKNFKKFALRDTEENLTYFEEIVQSIGIEQHVDIM